MPLFLVHSAARKQIGSIRGEISRIEVKVIENEPVGCSAGNHLGEFEKEALRDRLAEFLLSTTGRNVSCFRLAPV